MFVQQASSLCYFLDSVSYLAGPISQLNNELANSVVVMYMQRIARRTRKAAAQGGILRMICVE